VGLQCRLSDQDILTEVLVTPEIDSFHFVTGSTFDVVNQLDIRALVLRICCYFRIEVALALEKIDEIPAALFHQVRIDGTFGKYRD